MTVLWLSPDIAPLRDSGLTSRTNGHSVSTRAPLGQRVTQSLAGVSSSVEKGKAGTVEECTHPADSQPQVTSSSLSSPMASLVPLLDPTEKGPLPELTLSTWRSVQSSFSSAPWSPSGQLAPLPQPGSSPPPSSYTCPEGGRPWPRACSGSSWKGLAVIVVHQKLKSHKQDLVTSGPQFCRHHQPKEVGFTQLLVSNLEPLTHSY